MAIADYYSDTTSFNSENLIEWGGDWAYLVTEDTYTSEIFGEGDVAFERIIIKEGANLYIDYPFDIVAIRVGDCEDNEEGNLIFLEVDGIDKNNPHITFEDDSDAGLYLHKGSLEVSYNSSWGASLEGDYRFVISSNGDWKVYTGSCFDPTKFILKRLNTLELYNLYPRLHFTDSSDIVRDLDLDPIISYTPTTNISLKITDIEGGRSAWKRFDRSKGKEFTIEASHDRGNTDRFLEGLERIAEVNQRFAPLLLSTRHYLGYALIQDPAGEVSNPVRANYSITFQRIKEEFY